MEKLTMPKLVINAGMDEFFLPDDGHYWWDDMTLPKKRLIVPNAEHSEATGILELLPAVGAFFNGVIDKAPGPAFDWKISADGTDIAVQVDAAGEQPLAVHMWHATTCDSKRRDFRIVNKYEPCLPCGLKVKNLPFGATCTNLKVIWHQEALNETAPGSGQYVAHQDPPSDGRWTAFMVDLTFEGDQKATSELGWPILPANEYEFTTEMSIVPQTFPFPDCTGEACHGTLI